MYDDNDPYGEDAPKPMGLLFVILLVLFVVFIVAERAGQ